MHGYHEISNYKYTRIYVQYKNFYKKKMKYYLLFALSSLLVCVSSLVLFDTNLDDEWEGFKKQHNRIYKSSNEESYR